VQADELDECVKNIESGCHDEKLERDSARSPQEKPGRRSYIDSEAARADRDGSAEEPEGTTGPLVAYEGEGMLKRKSDGGKTVG
jgi:hypothetical protein